MRKRRGRFVIPLDVVNNMIDHKINLSIFEHFIIVRAETLHIENVVEYHAYSTLFDEIEYGYVIPTYNILISSSTLSDGSVKYSINSAKRQ